MISRESTGIKGVDSMIKGGLPAGSITGISGPPGVGKSIFTMHFLLEGARKGQKCVYLNLEEPKKNIDNMIQEFDFAKEFQGYVKKGKIVIKCLTYEEYEKIQVELLNKIIEDKSVKRLAIDSFNCFFTAISPPESAFASEAVVRSTINKVFSILRQRDLTSLLVLERQLTSPQTAFYYNIPHHVDGIINLDFLELGTIERRLFIPKMRWTQQSKESKEYDIGKPGIILRSS